MQERGLSAYLAELIGTLWLVFFITSIITLYVSTGSQAQFGTDYAVVGLVEGFALLSAVVVFAKVSGGHFNPVVTMAAALIKRINPLDAVIYILAQLSGGVLGALLTKGLLLDEGRATNYGAGEISGMLGGHVAGAIVEAIGAFCLVLVVLFVLFSKDGIRTWAAFAIGTTYMLLVMVFGPLTSACFNPARWFGPALVGNSWGGVWPYLIGPIVGALAALLVFKLIIEAGDGLLLPGRAKGSTPTPRPPAAVSKPVSKPAPSQESGESGSAA